MSGAVAALALWGALAVTQLGYVWPWPQVLPDTISFHTATYFRQAGCHPRRWWDEHGGLRGAETARPLGTLTSALGVGGVTEYGINRRAFNGYLLVPSGHCFAEYQANASGY